MIVDLLINRKKRKYILKWSIIFGVLLLIPLIVTDSLYYGKLVIAPLNIVLYNVFSSHGANLYGTEPWSFYFSNLLLNFNLALVASAASLPVMVRLEYVEHLTLISLLLDNLSIFVWKETSGHCPTLDLSWITCILDCIVHNSEAQRRTVHVPNLSANLSHISFYH